MLVLEKMPKVFVGKQPKQQAAARETGGELEIREVGAAVTTAQPVLLLGEIVVAYPRPVQLAKRRFGGCEICAVAVGFCYLQSDAVDPTTHQRAAAGEQERWSNAELARNGKRASLACEQMARNSKGPPRDFVDPAQHCLDLARRGGEAAPLHGGEEVALVHDAARPTPLDFPPHPHPFHSAAATLNPLPTPVPS